MSTLLSGAAPLPDVEGSSPGARRPWRAAGGGPTRAGWQAALIATVGSVAAVLVPLQLVVLLAWVSADTAAGPSDALAVGGYGWLLGHGVPLELGSGSASLRPLGLLVAVLFVLHRSGGWAVRTCGAVSPRAVALLVAQICGGYGVLVAGVAAATLAGPARPQVPVAAGAGLLLAALGAGTGALRGSGLLQVLRARMPLDLRVALDAGVGAALVLVAGSALVVLTALAVQSGRVVGLSGALGPGLTGWPSLILLNLMLVPNAVVYALSFAVGPGFALGAGTSVWLGSSSVGPLPPLSLLAAVPEGEAPPPYAYAVLLVPLVAGVAAGLLAVTRAPGSRAEQAALRGLYAGLVAGLVIGVLSWLSGGSLGPGRLAQLGPTGWLIGSTVAVQVGVIAAVTAWLACPRTATSPAGQPELPATAATPADPPAAAGVSG